MLLHYVSGTIQAYSRYLRCLDTRSKSRKRYSSVGSSLLPSAFGNRSTVSALFRLKSPGEKCGLEKQYSDGC